MSDVVARLAQLAKIGAYDGGIDRPLATRQERKARELFAAWARESGYSLHQDRVGNLFARRTGARADLPGLLVGSHLDTVPTGGAYDGAYGVTAALCALEQLDADRIETMHPIEAVAWAGEEGSRFPLGCLGSSVFAGLWKAEDALALRDAAGTTLRDALAGAETGLLPDISIGGGLAAAAYLELHVEQGPVLESMGLSLGVVTAIAGQRRYTVHVDGRSGHAGTVPMDRRADPLGAAAEMLLATEAAARRAPHAVATAGRITAEPGGTNVIPARAVFSLDIRSGEESQIETVESALRECAARCERERGVTVGIDRHEARPPTPMDSQLRAAVHRAIEAFGGRAVDLPSGAGHDAMALARIVPAAMIFVPSAGGVSHVAQERTDEADLRLGVKALAAALVEVDKELGSKQ
jgi:N-carbamoyl-L-amino-acid hydrolase